MASIMLLYDIVRSKLGDTYPNITYQTMRSDVPGDVGIYLYESSNDKQDISGDDIYNCIKVQVQVNAEQSIDGMAKALDYLTEFTKEIEKGRSGSKEIAFIEVNHIGPRAIPIGRNEHNILVCRSVIDLKYVFI